MIVMASNPVSPRWYFVALAFFLAVIAGIVLLGDRSAEAPVDDERSDDSGPAEVDDEAMSSGHGSMDSPVDFMAPPPGHDVEPLRDLQFGPTEKVTAFFPAQANLQWLSADVEDYGHPVAGEGTSSTHPGGALTAACADCHVETDTAPHPRQLGERLVDTSAGVAGKRPWVDVDLRAAFDDDYFYLQASWQSDRPRPGITHQSFQLLDGQWQRNTTGKDSHLQGVDDLGDNEFFDYEDRFAVMVAPEGQDIRAFGDEGPSFDEIGCAVGCHASMRNMPELPDADEVAAHPYLGDEGLGENDIRHYLLHTRDAEDRYRPDGAWASIDADYDAGADLDDGNHLDLWQYRDARSAPMYGASNDYVMEYRHSGAGGENYWFNQNPAAQADDADELTYDSDAHRWRNASGDAVDVAEYAWMYDIAETGFYALPAEAIDDESGEISARWARHYPLITQGPDRNAIPLDESLLDDGALITRRALRFAAGIRGRTHAFSRWYPLTNTYTVIFRSPLEAAESDLDYSVLHDGGNLTIAVAIFDDHSSNRFHHIGFPLTVGPGDDADLRARQLPPQP